jgi:Flp pilus assembly protein TadG
MIPWWKLTLTLNKDNKHNFIQRVDEIMKIKSQTLNQSGASAVEFALILIPLMLILFGIVEFSVLFYNQAMLTNASREGARVGIRYEWGSAGEGEWPPESDVTSVVNTYVGGRLISFGPATVGTTVTDNNTMRHGAPRTVTVTYPYSFLILPNFVSGIADFNLTAQTIMRLE